jgi:uncharacterized protein YlxW (UPF0749 family)
MRARTLLLLLVVALIAGFAAVNWTAFATPTRLNLGLVTVEAPLGLTMLGLVVVVTLAFAIHMALWQGAILLEARRSTKEMQTLRTLADQAEASRFTELRAVLHAEIERLAGRVSATEDALRKEIRENSNSLQAMLGEIDERMRLGRPGN